MSKLETLFVQIFDRRNWIVDQLKSQEESYDQSLASCLLINGIEPPPWLLSAGFGPQNADLIELKKELTTETLLPQNHTQFEKDAKYMQTNLELDESLLRIQRSRSRQRDLELRSSAKRGRTKHAHEKVAGDEYVCRVNRSGNLPSPKTNFVILAKQLDLDDTGDCSSSNSFQAALEKEKVDPFAEKKATAQLEAAHSSKRKSILDGFRERSGPDAEQMKPEEAVIQPVDVPNKVEIDQSEKQLDMIADTSLKNNISKSCGDAVDENCSMGENMSKIITTEACAHLSATFSDGVPKVSRMITFTTDNISALPELGGKDGHKITQTAENNFLDPVLNCLVGKNNSETDATAADKVLETSVISEKFMDKVVGEVSSCTPDEKINVELTSMLPSDCGFVGDATNGFAKSRSFHSIKSSFSLEPRVPKRIEVEGKDICSIAPNSGEKKNTRTVIQGSSEKCDQRKEPRYFLRSSTGHKKIPDSLKLNISSIVSEKYDMAEDVTDACVNAVRLSGTPCAAEVCYELTEKDVTDACVSAAGTPHAAEFFYEPMAKDVTDTCMSAGRLSGTSCAAEVCCGPKESSELVDGYVDHYQSPGEFLTSIDSEIPSVNAYEQVNQRFGPNLHHTSVESLRGSTSAGKQVVSSCSDICNEQLDVPCNLRYSMSRNKNVGLSQSSVSVCLRNSLQLPFNLTNACEVSWPMNKRRKVKNCSNCVFHTSPRIGRKNPLMQIFKEKFVDHLSLLDSPVDVAEPHNCSISQEMDVGHLNVGSTSIGFEINSSMLPSKQKGFDAMTKLRSSSFLGVEKGGLNIEGIVNQVSILDTMEKMEVEEMVEKQQEDAGLHDCLKETVEVVGSSCRNKEMIRRPTSASAESLDQRQLSLRGEGKKEEKLQSAKNPAFSYYSASTAFAGNLETGQVESLPELEGFCMSVSPVCELPLVTGDGNGIDNLDLSCIKKDLPVFEQVYKCTSLPVSVSCPSVLDSMMDIKYSLPAELFQQMNLKHFIPQNGIDEKQFLASEDNFPSDIGSRSSVEYCGRLQGKSYSFTPPVGKLTSKSTVSSLGKSSSLNKELTCFRIDEDSCINEESEIHEVVGPSEDVMRSRDISTLHKRGVLADVTKKYNDPISLASDSGKIQDLSSLASVNTDVHLERTQSVDSGLENGSWAQQIKNADKENCDDSMYGCCARNTSESFRNRPDRQKFSGKVSEAKGGQSFIDKASKLTNLVSNISSFLPFVQQKPQQPAILTGKRDIKVKALEAAEAAKRLEIERENARKIRKEAAKLEREKLEKENMRQLELKQKKREEERKKKEADIAARKRQREEEERKGKERKRRCVEEVRKQQQEREEKLRVEKEEKEMRRKAAQEERKRKALSEEARLQHKMEKGKEGNGNKKRKEQEKRTTKIMTGASNICENSILVEKPDSSENVVNDLDSFKLVGDEFPMTEASLEPQSYEISPYQPSDDEEEEEEGEVLVKKFIPEWAREKSIARSLDFLQHVNPDDIFLPERCFNINEICCIKRDDK